MNKRRPKHTPEEIIDKLRQAEELKAEGHDTQEIARQLNVCTASLYAWRKKYEGMTK